MVILCCNKTFTSRNVRVRKEQPPSSFPQLGTFPKTELGTLFTVNYLPRVQKSCRFAFEMLHYYNNVSKISVLVDTNK